MAKFPINAIVKLNQPHATGKGVVMAIYPEHEDKPVSYLVDWDDGGRGIHDENKLCWAAITHPVLHRN
ncbi:hypothetical protein [Brenneria corticis]|uniref:Uncharacterized protein n=1 Tax=Brenneria corticis TaxID=2173106 RepID=A0A2U1TM48_9GAMM|nr:hypothetical protein [Brenneria sp. CFCC 11842]PWC10500.1 hypothetical protein DDT56_21535 [Brenneria sp. CFCC 11842]